MSKVDYPQPELGQIETKLRIENLLSKYQVQPVGDGYTDLIVTRNRAVDLIQELAQVPVAVVGQSWWCLCTPQSRTELECPHGLGGPQNKFGEGFFSECVALPFFEIEERGINLDDSIVTCEQVALECSRILCDYIQTRLPLENFYSECLHPGLWLNLPSEWQRIEYLVVNP